jgi:DNA modification methylase
MEPNRLYYGDNLDVLRRYIKDESVDLIYLDPPFNSNATYNVLFAEQDGSRTAAQIKAFEDTWRWDQGAVHAYGEALAQGQQLHDTMTAFAALVGRSNMLAYLSMMSIRLVDLRRVMKPTASIYLHCDPTASHYLKVLMDAVFGAENFRNEITWKRTHSHGGAHRFGPVHDTLLFYSRSDQYVWRPQHVPYSDDYLESKFRFADADGRRYRETILTGSGTRNGSSGQPWRGVNPTTAGRHWAIPGYVRHLLGEGQLATAQDALDRLDAIGRVKWPAKGGVPVFKQYLDDLPGSSLQDVWIDIFPLDSQARERLGYPTQKPVALLERIVEASSEPGDVVLDPFCGCGTSIDAAQRLGRSWIGIDITHIAINLIKSRLHDTYGDGILSTYTVVGEPADLESAEQLAAEDPWQFQAWALDLVNARVAGSDKKGGDKGIDGRLIFAEDDKGGFGSVILSVKAGSLAPTFVDALLGVVESNGASIGAMISMHKPTPGMYQRAAKAGLFESKHWGKFPKIQLLTVEGLLKGSERLEYPKTTGSNLTYQRAKRVADKAGDQQNLFNGGKA